MVVPCFNEEAVIRKTHERLLNVMDRETSCRFEVLYVDDGSRDGTFALLQDFQAAEPRVRVVALSRNFGHQIAVTAGLEHAAGDAVVVMDADLQDPPEIIPRMLARWRDGVDVAYGVRRKRHGEPVFKRWTAALFYRLMAALSDTSISLDTGDFRLMDRRVVDAFLAMPERDRFVRGMVAWTGFRQEPVVYERQARLAGETSYTMKKMVSLAVCGIFSFSIVPLRVATWVGLTASGLSLAAIVYALVVRLFTEQWVRGWALLLIGVMFLGRVQLMVLGIFGEYLGRIYREVKARPLYLVRQQLGFPEHNAVSRT
ncbi:MAG: glycosyltransferase family 2 protein [Synechococcus sp. SB0676_bin_10]|uniref:Glycosyltransferase family 2 protein n=1 Tax=Synechococcus sp. SB0676_bin_10 TaxID=2604869 RepID=A0A6B1F5S1_9SYNE|nr:glycosyltransferase family 2 protein [Synechococcus sp. SB0676_bin_10]